MVGEAVTLGATGRSDQLRIRAGVIGHHKADASERHDHRSDARQAGQPK
jgi:hypothetical protein